MYKMLQFIAMRNEKNTDAGSRMNDINSSGWPGPFKLNRGDLTAILLLLILVTVGGILYLANVPGRVEKFTEFYILGSMDRADNYPTEVRIGEEADLTLGIVNRELEEVSYRVEVIIDEVKNKEVIPGVLAPGNVWEQKVTFIPTRPGPNKKVEFVLYKQDEDKPYLTLWLWINVKQP